MLEGLKEDHIKEAALVYRNKKYTYKNPQEEGLPPFERCVELAWLNHKMSQIPNLEDTKLFDFGCNKAKYIAEYQERYKMRTYGIDIKKEGKKYVDRFFHGEFNNHLMQQIKRRGTFRVAMSVSSVEHAGYHKHPDALYITDYQRRICLFLIDISSFFFLTVPYGKRPGWIDGIGSKKNFYQFDRDMLSFLKQESHKRNKKYIEEIYKYDDGYWNKSDQEATKNCIYRGRKQGATAVALISIYNRTG